LEPADNELVVSAVPELAEGEALVRVTFVGIDAAARTWLNDQPGYLPPVGLDEVIRAAALNGLFTGANGKMLVRVGDPTVGENRLSVAECMFESWRTGVRCSRRRPNCGRPTPGWPRAAPTR
jgi:hypothetical protein